MEELIRGYEYVPYRRPLYKDVNVKNWQEITANVLENADFSNELRGWRYEGSGTVTLDTNVYFGSPHSAKITPDESSEVVFLNGTTIPVHGGLKIWVDAIVKADSNITSSGLCAAFYTVDGKLLTFIKGTNLGGDYDWKAVREEFTAPQGAAHALVGVYFASGSPAGNGWIDSLSTPSTSLLYMIQRIPSEIISVMTGTGEIGLDSGTATGGSTDTLEDSSKDWGTDTWVNCYVEITDGTGKGQIRRIVSNDATTLTVASSWTTPPDNTSKYRIFGVPSAERTLESIDSKINTALDTRASESTLSSIASNIDAALSTRASEATLSDIKSKTGLMTFDPSNYLYVDIGADSVGLATEATLSAFKTQGYDPGTDTYKVSITGTITADSVNISSVGGVNQTGADWTSYFENLTHLNVDLSTIATEATLSGIKSQTDRLNFDANDYLRVSISADTVHLATEATLSGIKAQTDKLNFDRNNYLYVNIAAETVGLATENTLLSLNSKVPSMASDGSNYLYVHLGASDLDIATETTLSGVKSQTDKLSFDGSNYLYVNIGASDVDIATETTLSGIKSQTDKLSFDSDNRLITRLGTQDFDLLDSTTAPLASGGTYTGSWQACSGYSKVVGTVISDQQFELWIDFSNDGTNVDKSIKATSSSEDLSDGSTAEIVDFYVEIPAPYVRMVIKNTSGSNQSYLRAYLRGRVI